MLLYRWRTNSTRLPRNITRAKFWERTRFFHFLICLEQTRKILRHCCQLVSQRTKKTFKNGQKSGPEQKGRTMTGSTKKQKQKWYQENRERILAKAKAAYAANPEKFRERHLAYYRAQPREILRARYLLPRERAMMIIAQRWGDDIPRCRSDTLSISHPLRAVPCFGALEIDHINGGGNIERET